MNIQENCSELTNQIDTMRKQMINTGLSKGLNNLETIKYSKELDRLITKYQRLTWGK